LWVNFPRFACADEKTRGGENEVWVQQTHKTDNTHMLMPDQPPSGPGGVATVAGQFEAGDDVVLALAEPSAKSLCVDSSDARAGNLE
jgi:hypothetical protein